MKKVLLLDCSPNGSTSHSYDLAQKAIANLRQAQPHIQLAARSIGLQTPPPLAQAYATAITSAAPHSSPAFEQSEELIRELEDSDYLILSTPMHNFTVPASLKLWIDYVLRIGRTFRSEAGWKVGILKDRPALVIVSSGGIHTGENARQPDFLSPYVSHALLTIGIKDVRFIYLQGMVRPDMVGRSLAEANETLTADPVFGQLPSAL